MGVDAATRVRAADAEASPTPLVVAVLAAQTLLSSGTHLFAKRSLEEIPAPTLMLARFAIAGLAFVVLLLVTKGPKMPPREAWGKFLFLGLLAGPVNQGLFLLGLDRSTASHAGILYALTPLGVYLVALSRGQEALRGRRFFGIVVAFAGVTVLLLGRGLAAAKGPLIGDLLILGAVVAWVWVTVEGKGLIQGFGPVRTTAWSMTASALLSLPALPFFFDVEEVRTASPVALAGLLYMALVTSVFAYLLWYWALARSAASKVAVFSNLQPVATALLAFAILNDPLRWEIFAGGALVLLGVRQTQKT